MLDLEEPTGWEGASDVSLVARVCAAGPWDIEVVGLRLACEASPWVVWRVVWADRLAERSWNSGFAVIVGGDGGASLSE